MLPRFSAKHPEVEVEIQVSVARSADEAERLFRGEDVTIRRDDADDAEDEAAAAAAAAAAVFEPGAGEAAGEDTEAKA